MSDLQTQRRRLLEELRAAPGRGDTTRARVLHIIDSAAEYDAELAEALIYLVTGTRDPYAHPALGGPDLPAMLKTQAS